MSSVSKPDKTWTHVGSYWSTITAKPLIYWAYIVGRLHIVRATKWRKVTISIFLFDNWQIVMWNFAELHLGRCHVKNIWCQKLNNSVQSLLCMHVSADYVSPNNEALSSVYFVSISWGHVKSTMLTLQPRRRTPCPLEGCLWWSLSTDHWTASWTLGFVPWYWHGGPILRMTFVEGGAVHYLLPNWSPQKPSSVQGWALRHCTK